MRNAITAALIGLTGVFLGSGAVAAPPVPAPPPVKPVKAPGLALLPSAATAKLQDLLAREKVRAVLGQPGMQGGLLVVPLAFQGLTAADQLDAVITSHILPAMRAAVDLDPELAAVRLVFLACYRDKLGELSARGYETVQISRDLFRKLKFENLTQDEALEHFTREQHSYERDGFKIWWRGPCTPGAAVLPPEPPPSEAPSKVAAVNEALRWLAAHQSPDGGWESEGFDVWCNGATQTAERPSGAGKGQYAVGVTGLALLAFLHAGHTPRSEGPFGKVVKNGLRYLIGIQDREGCFAPRVLGHFLYCHGTAALAMVEAYAATGSDLYWKPAQRGLDFGEAARNPGAAWRYGVRPGENDTSMTGWLGQVVLRSLEVNAREVAAGRTAPFTVADASREGIRTWIARMTDPDTGRVGYQVRGSGPARPTELADKFPHERSEAMTAVGVLLRTMLGEEARSSDAFRKGVGLCSALLPIWNPNDGSIDMYYWYYASAALKRVGGKTWLQWRSALRSVAEANQRREGDPCLYAGSWDPADPWGPDGGRVYSTAIMAISLQLCSE